MNNIAPHNSTLKGYLLLLSTFFIWGSVYVVGKYSMGVLSPVTIAGGRYLIAFIVMMAVGGKRYKVKIDKADWKYFFIIGVLGHYLQTIVNLFGVQLIGASTASLINSMNPVSISIVAAILLHERIDAVQISCIVLSVIGAVVITSGADGNGQVMGVLLSVSAIILWAVASVSLRKMAAKYGVMPVTIYGIIISLMFYIPTMAVDIIHQGGLHLTWGAAGAVLYLGIFGTALAGYLWTKALSMLEASVCSVFYPLQALFSALLGAAFLHERFQSTFYIGAAIIAVSVAVNCLHHDKTKQGQTVLR
ncbi:MAG: DMT family transporter [Clostridia bacterium]